MRRRTPLVAVGVTLALALAACGGSGSSGGSSSGNGTFNAGLTSTVNQSTKTGGTLRIGNAGDWDNVDPADTYVGAGGRVLRLPQVLAALHDLGWTGVSLDQLAGASPLRALATRMTRSPQIGNAR